MHTITLDDESLAVSAMQRALHRTDPGGTHIGVLRVDEFLDHVTSHRDLDIAFIDIEMGTDGITVTRCLKALAPEVNIVIYSGHPQYKADALDEHVSSFIVKPVTQEKLQVALDNLRHPLKTEQNAAPLRVITFGSFVVYRAPGQVMTFSVSHSLAVLAYLIDRCGTPVTAREIAADVFGRREFDTAVSKDISKYVLALIKDLTAAGFTDAVIKQHKLIRINTTRISCDLYEALHGNPAALAAYHDDYLPGFAWSQHSEHIEKLRVLQAQQFKALS
ncbi:MAG: response regulator [Oscillospiraceae bacterium]|nr:response regulator [Oscillospiraceae bacterium]